MSTTQAAINMLRSEWMKDPMNPNQISNTMFVFTPEMVNDKFGESFRSLNRVKFILRKEPKFFDKYVEIEDNKFTPRVHTSPEEWEEKRKAWKKKVWGV